MSAGFLAGVAGPAVAGGGGGNPPPVTPPPPSGGGGQNSSGSSNGGTYTAQVAQQTITLTGSPPPSGFSYSYTPPECWLQPVFLQPDTYRPGDPSNGPSDADSFWFWFGETFPGFAELIHGTDATPQVNHEFQQEQNGQVPAAWTGPNPIESTDVWWAPNWLQDASGLACAQALVATADLSDGFLGMEPPAKPGAGGPRGAITGKQLAALARAALRLPTVTVVTSPPPTRPATVNVPTYVSVTYAGGNSSPWDRAELDYEVGGVYLWAQVQTSKPTVQISTDAPAGSYAVTSDGTCAATAGGVAKPACSITFQAPTGGRPYAITATVTWTVTWSTSAGDGGTFPPATQTGTSTIQVQEVQTQS
jgi:hypothetical protein